MSHARPLGALRWKRKYTLRGARIGTLTLAKFLLRRHTGREYKQWGRIPVEKGVYTAIPSEAAQTTTLAISLLETFALVRIRQWPPKRLSKGIDPN